MLWFSPFGPLQLVLGFPIDPEVFEESPVFEFSVGGRRALLVNEYEIVRVIQGTYEEKIILVAHWVIRDSRVLSQAAREQGTVLRMTLEDYDAHPELEGERLVMDSDELHLRLYYDIES